MNYQNNPKGRQNFILDWLKEDPTLSYSVIFAKYSVVFAKSSKTFDKDWISSNNELKSYQETINKAKLDASIKEEIKSLKNGLKSKFDRLMNLQNLVDVCLEELATKQCNDTIVQDGKPKNIKRLMNQRELNDTRKTLKELQQEISKIEGDYAPTKSENTNVNINQEFKGFSFLPTENENENAETE